MEKEVSCQYHAQWKWPGLFHYSLKSVFFFCMVFIGFEGICQELFPSTEQASTLPKNVFAPRVSYQHFQEPLGRTKNWAAFRAMYGVTRSLTAILTVSGSNHHIKTYPGNLFYYFKNHHKKIYPALPFLLEGFHLYAKQRIYNLDKPQRHFRVAVYGEISKVFTVHDNAEPNLMGDNSGYGGGVIATKLMNRLSLSFTGGVIIPIKYRDSVASFRSGNALGYTISAGYRLFPKIYKSYEDVNLNVYMEMVNRYYGAAKITAGGQELKNGAFLPDDPYTYHSLIKNNYVELRPAVQLILSSTLRFDLGAAFPVIKKSYQYFSPLVFVNIQKYFY